MNATANQIVAMLFPLLTVAVVWLVALFVRRRLNNQRLAEKHEGRPIPVDEATVSRVTELLKRAERELHPVP